jgi:hypothetical protein
VVVVVVVVLVVVAAPPGRHDPIGGCPNDGTSTVAAMCVADSIQ